MLRFKYTAKQGPTKIVDGIIEAESKESAVSKLIQSGITPVDVSLEQASAVSDAVGASQSKFQLFKRIRLKDISLFTRQMSDLVESSVPILRALQIVSNQTQNVHFKEAIGDMYTQVQDGVSFSDSLAQYPNVFSTLYVNMVRTGEMGGHLDAVLNRLAVYLEKENETLTKVRSSLAYPILILIVGFLTVFVLMSFVIPRITVMFEDLDQSLPTLTILLINVSGVFAQFWWLIIVSIVFIGVAINNWIKTATGRLWLDSFKLKIPFLGSFFRTIEAGRFARSLGTLIESGIDITTALNSVAATVENVVLKEKTILAMEDVAQGVSLHEAFGDYSFFPEMAVSMISVGEETGHLDRGLLKIADMLEKQSDTTIQTGVSLFGPLVLVGIVMIVGVIVMAMLLPIFQMNLIVQ